MIKDLTSCRLEAAYSMIESRSNLPNLETESKSPFLAAASEEKGIAKEIGLSSSSPLADGSSYPGRRDSLIFDKRT